jgi:hypothetical protein
MGIRPSRPTVIELGGDLTDCVLNGCRSPLAEAKDVGRRAPVIMIAIEFASMIF